MKISIALSVLILALAAVFGWRDSQQLEIIKKSHQQLVAEAAQLGVAADPSHDATSTRLTKRGGREDKEAEARLVAKDFIAFAKEMEAMEKNGERPDEAMQKRIVDFMDRLMALDAKQLKVLIAEVRSAPDLEDDTRKNLIGFSIMTLSSQHPQSALALFTETADIFSSDGMAQHVVSSSLNNWAKEDPSAALEWARKNGEKFPDLVTEDAKRGLIQGAAVNDPKLAFKLIGELGLKETSQSIMRIVDSAKTPEARTAMLSAIREYLTTLTDEEALKNARTTSAAALGSNITADGFDAATKWLDSSRMTEEELQSVAGGISNNMPSSDIGKWVEWIGVKLPAGKSDDSIRRIVNQWTLGDYQAAGTWLTTMPDGPTKNISIRSYAETVSRYEPEAAAQWAVTLPPGKDRDRTLRNIYQNWPKKDDVSKAAAEAFKARHGIE